MMNNFSVKMTNADWDEVKRLAADFQKAQLSNALQKLSERNCVEIIMKLTETKLLDVIFTNDGKEYVTPQHLIKEVKDELYIHGGRINLTELANILNVDLSQVTKAAIDIEKHDKGSKIILGQLIDKSYTYKIAEEINDKLNQNGFINIADLTLFYDLPAEFLQILVEKELGKIIFGKQDTQEPRIFYNQGYIARNEAKIRGALSAITKPTPILAVLGQCSIPEKIFFAILETLQEKKQVPGVVTGKQSSNSIYVPTIYSKSQSEWVDNFYKQNGYLEYDALTRLGISDPKNFVKRHFPNEKLIKLDTVVVGPMIIDQVDANIEDVVATGSFTDIYPLLPSVFSPEDVEILLKETSSRMKSSIHIFATTVIVSDAYLQALYKKLEPLAEKKAKEAVESGKWLQTVVENKLKSRTMDAVDTKVDRKAERRKKAATGKAGGGSQGRETKTKSTKKKYHNSKNHDFDNSEDDQAGITNNKVDLELFTLDYIKDQLNKDANFSDMNEFVDELATHFHLLLNKYIAVVAEQLLQKNKTTNLNDLDDRLNVLISNIRVFEKGIKCLDKNDQTTMAKYLLKTLAVDFATEIFKLAAHQNVIQCSPNLTTEARQKMLQDLPKDVKEPLTNLHKALAGDSIEEFLNTVEPALLVCCLVLKKYDKKKDKAIIVGHREALLEQLFNTQDPALALHLTTAILFTAATENILYMSGRHVSNIVTFLQLYLQQSASEAVSKYHSLVLQFLSTSDPVEREKFQKLLEDGLQQIKSIAKDYKKQVKQDKVHES
ncbi:E3 UFM1-protein ligase 1 homolog isoform X2 [Phymastichus coffea]|uniref:E3 UFM1-protein ligase 1 homolog isoform X2 n=1 Tax=Phymastichus coffea TaxID=108790 RepID=UPI00273AAD39|nr:E3 UFM1-protein ligase 1 homolog isoform X2 [Phymastichus coffea]